MSASELERADNLAGAARQSGEAPPIQPAATVLLVRQGAGRPEVLLVQRSEQLVFGPGHWVFPGGRLDPADYHAAGHAEPWAAARHAATREVREETQLRIIHSTLAPLSIWTTPLGPPRRFRAYFFVCVVSEPQFVRVDGEEIVAHRWLTVADALVAFSEGNLPLMVPTQRTLEQFEPCGTVEDCLSLCREPARIEQHIG